MNSSGKFSEDKPIGELVPLASIPDTPLRDGKAPWKQSEPLTDFKSQCTPLIFGGGVFAYGKYNDDQLVHSDAALRALRLAFRYGMNALDTSPFYHPSEFVLGRALRILSEEYPRSSYFLITKCGRYGFNKSDFDYSPDCIRASIERSCKRLGTEYLDAALLHDAEFISDQPKIAQTPQGANLAAQAIGITCAGEQRTQAQAQDLLGIAPEHAAQIRGDGDQQVLDAARALFALKDQGIIRNVGMSGYPLGELLRLSRLIASHPPYRPLDVILNYSNHTLHADLLPAFLPLFAERPYSYEPEWHPPMMLNASAFSMGLFSDHGTPSWHPADPKLKQAVQLAHARVKNAAQVTDVPPITGDNVLGYTALVSGLRCAFFHPPVPTLLGMSTVEEVHTAVAAYRALTAEHQPSSLDPSLQEKSLRVYQQLSASEALILQTLRQAQVQNLCWPSPSLDS
ncbi:D-arabinose 1-dehydrogenase (NAD(+)) [Malassezia psittaci]|uniref:D-arabinose 1-dehydrogenase (NAD(+)) n=1 Tax=Malassezia psittaci TaxID=1821823 RepID=A0AAF0F768_9BASI|nr:D-arabinose 1-dehydrogenase (NAD(+)) [Malassezia psittaci]